MEEEKTLKLKKLIKELESIRGRHTELVSVYIPSGFNLAETLNMLREEYTLAQNVKDKTVRKNVMSALDKIIQHLRFFRSTPENGLVVFCGNVSSDLGKTEIKLWSIIPPEKITAKIYRCDQKFILDPIKELIREKEIYGLIVLDAREANIGLLKGKRIDSLKHLESTVPSKTVKGGMSSGRYDRLREEAIHEFLKEVGEKASEILLKENNLTGIIVGGPGPLKERFVKEDYLHPDLKKRVLGTKDTSYTGDYGLEELVKKSEEILENTSVVRERVVLERFFSELQRGGNVTYGFEETLNALEMGAVEKILISENFDWYTVKLRCECGNVLEKNLPKEKIDSQVCNKCGKIMMVEEKEEMMEMIIEKAKSVGSEVEFISIDTGEGMQFKELGGIGAFLRYRI